MTDDWETFSREMAGAAGSLPDLTVAGTSMADWQWLLDRLHSGRWTVGYSEDGEFIPMPTSAAEIFTADREASRIAKVQIDGLWLNCHFWTVEEIDFDIDPREVQDEAGFETLLRFMAWLGDSLDKPVYLSHEGSAESVILRYPPG